MSKKNNTPLFDAEDLPLVEKGLSLFEDLYMILYATKLATKSIKFPIKRPENLDGLFNSKGIFSFKDWKVSKKTVLRFVPEEFFPIENEEQFLTRMLMVLQMGRRTHQFDLLQKSVKRDPGEYKKVYLIPTPEPIAFYPNK